MNKEAENYVGYIRDLAYLLRERTVEAQTEKEKTESAFEEGREFGLRQALSLMQVQADAFEIEKDEICLSGFDAMTEPVNPPPPAPREDAD